MYTVNIIVNINPFVKENTTYVTDDYINNLINSGPYNSIPKLLKYIHFHPKHSENHNWNHKFGWFSKDHIEIRSRIIHGRNSKVD